MLMGLEVSIVIGALREEKRIEKSLKNIRKYLVESKTLNSTEVVVVTADGGDKTIEIVEKYLLFFPHHQIIKPGEPVGKGRDIKLGMQAARGTVVLFMDADLATPLHHIDDAVGLIKHKAADIVIGVRNIRRMHNTKTRFLVSLLGNLAFSIVSGRYIPDTQCGFKAFNKKAVRQCFGRQTITDWSFDMELLIIGFSQSLSIAQLPIEDWRDVPGGTFSGGFSNTVRFATDLLIMLRNRMAGRYKEGLK
jgi:glycosyltransferase involved in cell wall biosynthesis